MKPFKKLGNKVDKEAELVMKSFKELGDKVDKVASRLKGAAIDRLPFAL
jgi:hypothetical protein